MAVSTPLFSSQTGAQIPPAGLRVPSGFKFAELTPSGRGLPEFFDPGGRLVTETAPGTFVPTARFQGFPLPGGFFNFAKGFAGFLGTLAPLIVGIPALAGVPLGGAAAAAGAAGGGIPAISATEFGEAGDLGSIGLVSTEGATGAALSSGGIPAISATEFGEAGDLGSIGAGAGGGIPAISATEFGEGGDLGSIGLTPAAGAGTLTGGFSIAKALKLLPLAAGVISLQGHTGNSDLFTNPTTGANPSGSNAGTLQDPLAGLAGGLASLLGGGGPGGGGDSGGGGGGSEGLGRRGLTLIPTQGRQTGFLLLALATLAAGGVWFYLKNRKR